MKRDKSLGVVLVAVMSGSVLIGCTSDNADKATPTTTPTTAPLVGSWVTENPKGDAWGVALNLSASGLWSASSWDEWAG